MGIGDWEGWGREWGEGIGMGVGGRVGSDEKAICSGM